MNSDREAITIVCSLKDQSVYVCVSVEEVEWSRSYRRYWHCGNQLIIISCFRDIKQSFWLCASIYQIFSGHTMLAQKSDIVRKNYQPPNPIIA